MATKNKKTKTTTTRKKVGKKIVTTTTTVIEEEEMAAPPTPRKRNYVSIHLDSSGSMNSLRGDAIRMYNETVQRIKAEALATGQDTFLSLYVFGGHWTFDTRSLYRNVPISMVQELTLGDYLPSGNTPMFDCIGLSAIEHQRLLDSDNKNTSFLMITITDGEENSSKKFDYTAIQEILRYTQATDRWTHTFLIPRGYKSRFVAQYGVFAGNVAEWDQTAEGVRESSNITQQGISDYFALRSKGIGATQSFYTDVSKLSTAAIRRVLTDLSPHIRTWEVPREVGIRDFVESKLGRGGYVIGNGYYQLTKTEKVQAYKRLLIVEKGKSAIYGGDEARDLLGLPRGATIKVIPGNHGKYDIFVQSTSVNRKLVRGTRLLLDTLHKQNQQPTWDHVAAGIRP